MKLRHRYIITSDFFLNAVTHLHSNASDAAVIGIQEYHPPTRSLIMAGFAGYECHEFSHSINNDAKVFTIWKPAILGKKIWAYDWDLPVKYGESYDKSEGNLIDPAAPGGKDLGRPISIVFTDKGYFLLNFHGVNVPQSSGKDNSVLRKLIQYHVEKAFELASVKIKFTGIDANRMIIMCDSNDRSHLINSDTPLELKIMGTNYTFHDGRKSSEGIVSCCYNWDSCGMLKEPENNKESLGADGAESKYKFSGDYVLGTHPISLKAVDSPTDHDGASTASDHKLVICEVKIPDTESPASIKVDGGRRFKTRRYKKARKSNAKRTRKTRKN